MISNLINNSIEARKSDGATFSKITIQKNQNQIEITIQAKGKGISSDLISKIFDEGFTHGKKGGMVVGLKHTQKESQYWGGKIQMKSKME